MCKSPIVVCVALFLANLSVLFLLFTLYIPLYMVSGTSATPTTTTFVYHGIFHSCFHTKHNVACATLSHSLFSGTGEGPFKARAYVTIACAVLAVALCITIVILGLLDCFGVINITRGSAWIAVLLLAILQLGFSIATAAIPTSEFVSEKSKFNNMKSRSQCFWGKVLKKISTSADVTILPPNELISFTKDLQSDQYLLQIGWILPVVWIGCILSVAAVMLFALIPCVYRPAEPLKNEEKNKRDFFQKKKSTIKPPSPDGETSDDDTFKTVYDYWAKNES